MAHLVRPVSGGPQLHIPARELRGSLLVQGCRLSSQPLPKSMQPLSGPLGGGEGETGCFHCRSRALEPLGTQLGKQALTFLCLTAAMLPWNECGTWILTNESQSGSASPCPVTPGMDLGLWKLLLPHPQNGVGSQKALIMVTLGPTRMGRMSRE